MPGVFRRRPRPAPDPPPGGVLVVTAMRRELAGVPVRGRTRSFLLRRQRRGEWRAVGADEIDVDYHAAYGGMGTDLARETAEIGIEKLRPRLVVSAGYAGGLDPTLRLGAVVTAGAVLAPDGARFDAEPLGEPAVTVATADVVVATPAEKAALFAATGAAVVEMEAAGVAAACAAAGVRFAAVKVVTDAAGDAVPTDLEPFFALDRGDDLGAVAAALTVFVKRPAVVRDLWRLGASANDCSRALGERLRAELRSDRQEADAVPFDDGRWPLS